MTQERALAGGQQDGQEMPFLGEQFWRHRRVHASMDAVQLPGTHGPVDDRAADPGSE